MKMSAKTAHKPWWVNSGFIGFWMSLGSSSVDKKVLLKLCVFE